MTPPARWRPTENGVGVMILGPALCHGCQAPVWYGRARTHLEGSTVMGEVRAWREWGRSAIHHCEPKRISKRGLYCREYRARRKHRLIDQSRAEFDRREVA